MLGFFPSMTFGEDISFPESFDIFVVVSILSAPFEQSLLELTGVKERTDSRLHKGVIVGTHLHVAPRLQVMRSRSQISSFHRCFVGTERESHRSTHFGKTRFESHCIGSG